MALVFALEERVKVMMDDWLDTASFDELKQVFVTQQPPNRIMGLLDAELNQALNDIPFTTQAAADQDYQAYVSMQEALREHVSWKSCVAAIHNAWVTNNSFRTKHPELIDKLVDGYNLYIQTEEAIQAQQCRKEAVFADFSLKLKQQFEQFEVDFLKGLEELLHMGVSEFQNRQNNQSDEAALQVEITKLKAQISRPDNDKRDALLQQADTLRGRLDALAQARKAGDARQRQIRFYNTLAYNIGRVMLGIGALLFTLGMIFPLGMAPVTLLALGIVSVLGLITTLTSLWVRSTTATQYEQVLRQADLSQANYEREIAQCEDGVSAEKNALASLEKSMSKKQEQLTACLLERQEAQDQTRIAVSRATLRWEGFFKEHAVPEQQRTLQFEAYELSQKMGLEDRVLADQLTSAVTVMRQVG